MTLGVKESVSGKRIALNANGDEVRVCGGKGAVYLSGNKVALRCCGKTSIVATKRMKQSVLRQGDVTLLELRDMFYANGTLTKYEVIDVDVTLAGKSVMLANMTPTAKPKAAASRGAPVAPARISTAAPVAAAPSTVVSSYFHKPHAVNTAAVTQSPSTPHTAAAATSPKAVSDVASTDVTTTTSSSSSTDAPLSATKKRLASVVIVDDDFSNDDDDDDDDDDNTPIVRSKPHRAAKKSRAIVESDADSDDDDKVMDKDGASANAIAIDSDVSSPREVVKVALKQEKAGTAAGTRAANWMAAFANGARDRKAATTTSAANTSPRDGWHSVSDLKDKRSTSSSSSKRKASATTSVHSRLALRNDGGDDSGDDEHHVRTHDEVGQLLRECKQIAHKLRQSIQSWSGSSTTATTPDSDDTTNDEQVTIAAINSASADRRVITQDDIPSICPTLELKPYQVVGINWLLLLCEHSVSGVLADEMGLGKTVQTVAFLLLLDDLAKRSHARVCRGPHVVVVPASVLSNWQREFAWIAPTLRVVVYHGSKDSRLDLQASLAPDTFDVLLTTYSYFERDSCQDDRAFLRSFQFGYMVLDEGHSIKNAKTSRFKRISQMRARQRLVLSGTPIQNNLNELLALLSFLMPRMFDHGSDELLLFFDGSEQSKCAKVRQILAPFILRREKKYVLHQLVAKTVVVEMLTPGAAQQRAYTDLVEAVVAQKAADAARKADEKARKKQRSSKADRLLLGLDSGGSSSKASGARSKDAQTSDVAVFTQLRKAANHPVLLRNHYVDDAVLATMSRCLHRAEAFGTQCTIAMVRKELETYCDFELHDLCVQYSGNDELRRLQLPMDTLLASAKFDYLRTLLPTLAADGHRVLIFSQWTKLLDLLEVLMGHMQYRYLRLDGSTDVAERQDLIDTYNADTGIFVFLLSTRAGGLGINLTAADTVILHDLDFNPTNDEQACDRCHRIGQTKPVSIYKLVTEHTVDHDIYKLGESKTQLNHAVLGKLNAHSGSSARDAGASTTSGRKASDGVTVEMMLASVISNYKKPTDTTDQTDR